MVSVQGVNKKQPFVFATSKGKEISRQLKEHVAKLLERRRKAKMRKGRHDPENVDCLAPPVDISRLIVEDYFNSPNDTNLTMSTVDAASDVENQDDAASATRIIAASSQCSDAGSTARVDSTVVLPTQQIRMMSALPVDHGSSHRTHNAKDNPDMHVAQAVDSCNDRLSAIGTQRGCSVGSENNAELIAQLEALPVPISQPLHQSGFTVPGQVQQAKQQKRRKRVVLAAS